MPEYTESCIVRCGQIFCGKNVFDCSCDARSVPGQQCEPVGKTRRSVQVVDRNEHAEVLRMRKLRDKCEKFCLVAEIEICNRFVEQKHVRFLGERACYADFLRFPSRQAENAPFCDRFESHCGNDAVRHVPVALRVQAADRMCVSPGQDNVARRIIPRALLILDHVCNMERVLFSAAF
jgi:hypothetical protein